MESFSGIFFFRVDEGENRSHCSQNGQGYRLSDADISTSEANSQEYYAFV